MRLVLLAGVLLSAGVLAAQTPYFHWYQLNEGSGAIVANTASQAGVGSIAAQGIFTDGTGVATPTWISPGGLGDDCVDLSSPTAFLDSGLDPDIHLNTSDFTVEALVHTNGTTQDGNVICAMCTSSAIELALYLTGGSVLALADGGGLVTSGGASINDNSWHHVALVYDRTAQTTTGYLDGSQVFQATSQSYTFTSNSKVVYLNGRTLSAFGRWSGLADELKLDNTARSPSAFVLPNPGSGGGGGGGGGDNGGCSTSANNGVEWVAMMLLVLVAGVRLIRTHDA